MEKPRILIPEPTSNDPEYNKRGWQQYADAVEQAGGVPVAVPLHASQEEQAQLIAGAQGVLLPGSHADVNPEKWNEPLDARSARPIRFVRRRMSFCCRTPSTCRSPSSASATECSP